MHDLPGRLLQNQARRGIEQVHSPLIGLAQQSIIIGRRIFAAQRKLKAAFAVLIAVACAQVAAGLRKHGHDVAIERRASSARPAMAHAPTNRGQQALPEQARGGGSKAAPVASGRILEAGRQDRRRGADRAFANGGRRSLYEYQ